MSTIWYYIKTTNFAVRALLLAGASYLAIEMFKPGFAFADIGGGSYVPRTFNEDQIIDEDQDTIVSGSYLTWWSVPLGLFLLFVLFV